MAPDQTQQTGLRVAVTGATGDLGRLLIPRLEADPRVASVLALDLARPEGGAKLEFRRVDLTRHDAESELHEALMEAPVDAVYHLAFLLGRRRNPGFAHEVEVAGSMHVLGATARAQVPRLILASTTAVYGAHGQHPALLGEDTPLTTSPASRFIRDKVEVERQVRAFRERHPEMRVLVLRFAPVIGPGQDNPVTRFLGRRVVPTLMGFDPLWQGIHEEDAADALMLALAADTSGEINVVGRGALPLSSLIREAGGIALPLPGPLVRAAAGALTTSGAMRVPIPLLDYIHFSWVADGARAEQALGFVPRHHTRDAVAALRRG